MLGITNVGGGSGEKHYSTIAVTTPDFIGEKVKCVGDGYAKEVTFSQDGLAIFEVNDWGTYTIYCQNQSKEVEVTAWYVTYDLEFIDVKIVTFADGTDEEIALMANAHYYNKLDITDYWAIGDRRTIGDREYVIIDFNHDDLAEPIGEHTKAAVTLQIYYSCPSGYMPDGTTRGWEFCPVRELCNGSVYESFPEDIKNSIKTVLKKGSNVVNSTTTSPSLTEDKVFLVSVPEAGGTLSGGRDEGYKYAYYNQSQAWSKAGPSVSYGYWWTRSPLPNYNGFHVGTWTKDNISYASNNTWGSYPWTFCL